jgi:SAM-dependent methyltransferase
MAGEIPKTDVRIQVDLPWEEKIPKVERSPLAEGPVDPSMVAEQREAERLHWDAFWAGHGAKNALFDRILWIIRRVFASIHARLLARRCRQQAAGSNPSLQFLEIGCGSATTSGYVGRHLEGSRGFAIDLSPEALVVARRRNPGLRCVVADALALPFSDGEFGMAFSSGVIEHFDRSAGHAMVHEHCRVVREGGIVAVTVPWKASPLNLLRILCGRRWPFGHESPFSLAELRSFLAKLALDGVEIRSVFATTLTGIGTRNHLPKAGNSPVKEGIPAACKLEWT